MKKYNKLLIPALLTVAFSCAKMVPPSGGPKDVTPPQIVKTIPGNFSKNISPNTIEIKFDEYVVLKNINDNLLVSPPLKHKPEIKVLGKKIIIHLKDTLKSNTTYIFNFGNSIADFTEGNILHNYKYVFSTGPYIDSLKISGIVKDAYTTEPEKNILVMLYEANCDSCLYNTTPEYITTTDNNGFFELANIKQGNYKLFCLKDINKNMIYDLPEEKIGFYDTTISPFVKTINDTTGTHFIYGPDSIMLFSFEESGKINAFIKKHKRINPATLQIIFNKPPNKKPAFRFLRPAPPVSYIDEFSTQNDSITILITDTTVWKSDTISLEIKYKTNDTVHTDTLYFKWFSKKFKPAHVKLSLKYNPLPPFKEPVLQSQFPILTVDTAKIKLYKTSDTAQSPIPYRLTIQNKLLEINFAKEEGESYKIIADSCAVTGLFGTCNDSSMFAFKVRESEYYGTLTVKLLNKPSHNIIVELTDNKHKTIYAKQIADINADSLVFNNLPPKDYALRIIYDRNNNMKWDAGNLDKRIQPERVTYRNNIKVKSSWENHMELDLNND